MCTYEWKKCQFTYIHMYERGSSMKYFGSCAQNQFFAELNSNKKMCGFLTYQIHPRGHPPA